MERMQGENEVELLERPSPLTDQERMMVQDSWGKVYQTCEEVGVTILRRLFGNFPSSKQFFSQFKYMELAEIQQSAHLRTHATRVMKAINMLVKSLDDAEKVASVLKLVGRAHALQHKVEPGYFKILNGVILEVLGEEFPELVTAEVAAAWTKLLASVYYGITAIYQEVGWDKLAASTG